ncbi:MAG: hypothetical protein V4737_18070, partial [Curtobacterium sp.]
MSTTEMAPFNEALHPRRADGKFTEAAGSAPEGTLPASTAGEDRAEILYQIRALEAAQRAYDRDGHTEGGAESVPAYEDFEDARIAHADYAEDLLRRRIERGTATDEMRRLVDQLDAGRSDADRDEHLEDALLDFGDAATSVLEDEALPVLTMRADMGDEEKRAAVRATFDWADDDQVARIARGESAPMYAEPEADWFMQDDPPMCRHCGSSIGRGVDGGGTSWGHLNFDPACSTDERTAAEAVGLAVTAQR